MRVIRPEVDVLTLEDGETLIVKKRLNAGERRAMLEFARRPDGTMDGLKWGLAITLAYLVDWTVTDELSGEPLVIKGESRDAVLRTLDSLDADDVREINAAIDAHDDRMIAERREEKKTRRGNPPSAPTSPSVPDLVFATPTSTR